MDGQTIFAIVVGAALAVFSLVMVGYAFFRGTSAEEEAPVPSDAPARDGVGLDAIYDSIETLELEFQLGNVTEEQYRQQLQGYRMQAALAVKALLESGEAPPELLLEQEVLAARSGMQAHPSFDSLPESGMDGEEWRACPQCDAPIPQGGAPCPHCGAAVETTPLHRGEDRGAP